MASLQNNSFWWQNYIFNLSFIDNSYGDVIESSDAKHSARMAVVDVAKGQVHHCVLHKVNGQDREEDLHNELMVGSMVDHWFYK